MPGKQVLYEIERELADGNGDTYRRHLADEAVVIVPGQAMSKQDTVQAMDASPGWDDFAFEDERFLELGEDAVLLTYRFSGRRGDAFEYAALMGSVYVKRNGAWQLTFHQQTPLE